MTALRVCGVDLSLRSTGLASILVKDGQVQLLTTRVQPGPKLGTYGRLRYIRTHVTDWAAGHNLTVIEGLLPHGPGSGQTDRAGLWWIVTEALDSRGLPFVAVSPATVKKYATGKGNADKDAVLGAAFKRLPDFDGGNDQADSSWLAAAGVDHLTGGAVCYVPQTHRAALAKVPWPEVTP